jgi:hypothetical protein
MSKIDLIIEALESAHHTNDTGIMGLTKLRHDVALAAARELKDNYMCLKKLTNLVDDIDIDFFGEVTK